MRRIIRLATPAALLLAGLFAAAPAEARFRNCQPVLNTIKKADGTDLFGIRVQAASCRTARRVARQGTLRWYRGQVNYDRWLIVGPKSPLPNGRYSEGFEAQADWPHRVRWTVGELGEGGCGFLPFSFPGSEASDAGLSVRSRGIRCPAARREVKVWFGSRGRLPGAERAAKRGWTCEQVESTNVFPPTRCTRGTQIISYAAAG